MVEPRDEAAPTGPAPEASTTKQTDQEWADTFDRPIGEADMEWVLRYAEERYRMTERHIDVLDAKADDLVKYVLGSVTLLVGLLGAFAKEADWFVLGAFLLPIGCGVGAVLRALSARSPKKLCTPPTIRFAMSWFAQDGAKAKQRIAASIHLAEAKQAEVAAAKGDALRSATKWLRVAGAGVTLPIALMAMSRIPPGLTRVTPCGHWLCLFLAFLCGVGLAVVLRHLRVVAVVPYRAALAVVRYLAGRGCPGRR